MIPSPKPLALPGQFELAPAPHWGQGLRLSLRPEPFLLTTICAAPKKGMDAHPAGQICSSDQPGHGPTELGPAWPLFPWPSTCSSCPRIPLHPPRITLRQLHQHASSTYSVPGRCCHRQHRHTDELLLPGLMIQGGEMHSNPADYDPVRGRDPSAAGRREFNCPRRAQGWPHQRGIHEQG